jgi:hypothetical protein
MKRPSGFLTCCAVLCGGTILTLAAAAGDVDNGIAYIHTLKK